MLQDISHQIEGDPDPFIEGLSNDATQFETRLDRACSEIDTISKSETLTKAQFIRLTASLNNISYILLYLESNRDHLAVDFLDDYKARLKGTSVRNERLLSLVERFDPVEGEFIKSRQAFIDSLKALLDEEPSQGLSDDLDPVFAALNDRSRRRADILQRLGQTEILNNPDTQFYQWLARDSDSHRRMKLATIWRRVDDSVEPDLCRKIDHIIQQRWSCLNPSAGLTIADRTLSNSRLSITDAQEFLELSLPHAIMATEGLADQLDTRFGCSNIDANFPFFIESLREDVPIPRIPLRPCIRFLCQLSEHLFGLEARQQDGIPGHLISYDLYRNGEGVGRINFDLWGKPSTPNSTQGLRNRTCVAGLVQLPVAHISCRFQQNSEQSLTINFQNAHSLFHEFGHALNHINSKHNLPNLSGLEYLPIERLETLSMWFERWVFHSEFGAILDFEGDALAGLRICQEIKRYEYIRTHLERHLLSLIDLDVHSVPGRTIRQSYDSYVQRFPGAASCALSRLLPSFAWPMMTTNPGGYFAYPWAAADSASRFSEFKSVSLADLHAGNHPDIDFDDCFDFDADSRKPDPLATFDFYRHSVLES